MCTVSVKVNEALLRGMRPELNSTAAIRQWAQQQIDLRIQQMELDDQETMTIEEAREMTHRAVSREYALDRDMTPEQLYAVISEEIDDIYANENQPSLNGLATTWLIPISGTSPTRSKATPSQ